MNRLSIEEQTTAISALAEGVSIRSVERMTGIHRDTIMRLMVRVGEACADLLDRKMQNLPCKRIEVDEVWTFVGKKQRHVQAEDDINTIGDFWTWVAFDPDTKIVPSFKVGKRDSETAQAFIHDLAYRLNNRIQLDSDGLSLYVEAVERVFGSAVSYAQIVKAYEAEPIGPGRYSPPAVISVEKTAIVGHPDLAKAGTSYVERQNLTMRMHIRRLTRLTNAFSKKVDNLKAAVALHFAYYNLVKRHGSLRMTPAMAANVTDDFWTVQQLIEVSD